MNCLFCKIAAKEMPAEVIFENDWALAFLDINPIAPGHAVIIPKKHANDIIDLAEDGVGPIFSVVKKVTELLKGKLSPDGFTIGINHGRAGGQLVDHLHIHVIPRWHDDGGSSIHAVVKNPPKKSIKEIKKEIEK